LDPKTRLIKTDTLAFVADQLDVDVSGFDRYQRRDQTRREQLTELTARFRLPDIRSGLVPALPRLADPDCKAYELCALSELRDRLRAGDVWVDGSRTFEILKSEGPLPLDIETDIDRYLEDRWAILDRELTEVAALATAGKLRDVDLSGGEL
jgi:Domain of unknown function (DUF4158)